MRLKLGKEGGSAVAAQHATVRESLATAQRFLVEGMYSAEWWCEEEVENEVFI